MGARRGEKVDRSFAHLLDRGGMRRTRLPGRINVNKRYLIHVAGFSLGPLMRAMHGAGTPKETADGDNALLFAYQTENMFAFVLVAAIDGEIPAFVWFMAPEPS